MDASYKKIFLKELEFFKQNFKSINIINVNDLKPQKKLPKNLKEKIKFTSVIDTLYSKEPAFFCEKDVYKNYAKKIKDKTNLKYR